MKPKLTVGHLALAFAVGSSVYFWYQFATLAALETQVSQELSQVGLNQLVTPNAATVAVQQQAPIVAGLAALATLFLA